MASNQTENYGLNQWEAEDKVLRTDFNADNAKIDTAIKAAADLAQGADQKADEAYGPENSPFVVGVYTGNGAASQTINLGFTPSAVLVMRYTGDIIERGTGYAIYYGGLALPGNNVSLTTGGRTSWVSSNTVLSIVDGGFQVAYVESATSVKGIYANASNEIYYYLAVK